MDRAWLRDRGVVVADGPDDAAGRDPAHGAGAVLGAVISLALVGTLLAVLGGLLVLRSWRRAQRTGWDAAEADDTDYAPPGSFALAAGMFFVYALLLVGRGLPFWLGTALFVTAFVFLFQSTQRKAAGQAIRGLVVALACGVFTALIVTLLFEQLFYVRLP